MSLTPLPRVAATVVLAFGGMLVLAGPGHAQQNSTVFPWQAGGGQGGYRSQNALFPPAAPAFYPPAPVESSRAFYPSAAARDTVRIDVTVPADAKVTFDGTRTVQTGTHRSYVSPAIAQGRYTYGIQAVWTENGREVRQSRSIPVQPGEDIQVTITRNGVTVRSEP